MNSTCKIFSKLQDPEYRKAFVASQIDIGLPFQIRALLKSRGWTQAELAESSNMLQPRISDMMKPGKTRPNVDTLRRIAQAFDVGLQIRFVPFGELVNAHDHFDPESFSVKSFADEIADNAEIESLAGVQATTLVKQPLLEVAAEVTNGMLPNISSPAALNADALGANPPNYPVIDAKLGANVQEVGTAHVGAVLGKNVICISRGKKRGIHTRGPKTSSRRTSHG